MRTGYQPVSSIQAPPTNQSQTRRNEMRLTRKSTLTAKIIYAALSSRSGLELWQGTGHPADAFQDQQLEVLHQRDPGNAGSAQPRLAEATAGEDYRKSQGQLCWPRRLFRS